MEAALDDSAGKARIAMSVSVENVPRAPIEALPVVHAVTNDEIMLRPGFIRKAMGVMRVLADKGAIHIRSQLLDTPTLHSLSLALLELHEQTKCWCIVNDRVDIALACGVQGVQLTHKSILVPDVQRIAPALRIGASVHSADEARDAEQAGADWCVAGHFFETPSHPRMPPRASNFIPEWGPAGSFSAHSTRRRPLPR